MALVFLNIDYWDINLKALVSCEHVISKDMITHYTPFIIYFLGGKREIFPDPTKREIYYFIGASNNGVYYPEKCDVSIVEILPEDEIEDAWFFELVFIFLLMENIIMMEKK